MKVAKVDYHIDEMKHVTQNFLILDDTVNVKNEIQKKIPNGEIVKIKMLELSEAIINNMTIEALMNIIETSVKKVLEEHNYGKCNCKQSR